MRAVEFHEIMNLLREGVMKWEHDLLLPGDVFFTRGKGPVSRLIRVMTRRIGESRTVANHVGLIAVRGRGMNAGAIEALSHVRLHRLSEQYDDRTEICVFRCLNISAGERDRVVAKAGEYLNRSYGYMKLLLHLLDWTLMGAYVFRRLGRMDKYPICSYLVASSFESIGKDFGIKDYGASPDDIWDFVTGSGKYAFIWQTGSMYRKKGVGP